MRNFKWMKIYFSPFKPPKIYFYIGKLKFGTPIFYPRKWIKNKEKPGYLKAIPKKIGFDFVGLGWKIKWDVHDYRHEWDPIWSFVFFKWQIAILFTPPHHYWECWLAYMHTNKKRTVKNRLKEAINNFPCIWVSNNKKTYYWYDFVKEKYLETIQSFIKGKK